MNDNINSPDFRWRNVVSTLWYFLGEDRWRYVAAGSSLFAVFFYQLAPPWIAGEVVDFFTGYQKSDSLLPFYRYCILLGVSYVIVALVRLRLKNEISRISIDAKTRARVLGFERLLGFSLRWHAKENTGNKVQKIFTGSQSIREWLGLTTNDLLPIVGAFVGILATSFFLSPLYLIFLGFYFVVFLIIGFAFNKRITALSDAFNIKNQAASGTYIEGAGNILSVKALGAQKTIHSRVRRTEEQAKDLQIAQALANTRKWYVFQIFNGIAFASFLFLIGRGVAEGSITVGKVLVLFAYFNRLRSSASDATDLMNKLLEMRSNLASMMPIFAISQRAKTAKGVFPKPWKSITIREGRFLYPSGQGGIQDLNFTLQEGERVGVIGLSGSGKSTLVKILLGLYPLEAGEFRVGEKTFTGIAQEEIIKNIAVVLQETELFNFSLQNNITLMRDVDPKLFDFAIKTSRLEDVIERLPKGLDTRLGERGYALSGGERQRVGIARAICKKAPIILLDEATSALDPVTEQEVMEGLLSEFANDKTFLIVAHRLSALERTNRIVVFDGGKIAEEHDSRSVLQSHVGLDSLIRA